MITHRLFLLLFFLSLTGGGCSLDQSLFSDNTADVQIRYPNARTKMHEPCESLSITIPNPHASSDDIETTIKYMPSVTKAIERCNQKFESTQCSVRITFVQAKPSSGDNVAK